MIDGISGAFIVEPFVDPFLPRIPNWTSISQKPIDSTNDTETPKILSQNVEAKSRKGLVADATHSGPMSKGVSTRSSNALTSRRRAVLNTKCLLVVEDEALIRSLMVECLTDAGFEVLEAEDGCQATEVMNHLDRLDLVLTDIQMPGGIDGNVVADRARERFPALSVIYSSGRPESLTNKIGHRDVFLHKPFGSIKLLAVISELLAVD